MENTKDSILCIGYQEKYLNEIINVSKDKNIIVIEEPTLIKKETIPKIIVVPGEYQQSSQAVSIAKELNKKHRIIGVVPIREYAVPVTNDIANSLNLPRIGYKASRCFRDKMILRETLGEMSLSTFSQPRFKKIRNVQELEEFFEKFGPCVIKPSSKQSTVGVFKISSKKSITYYYNKSLKSTEPGRVANDRKLRWESHAEELISGQEYSTEVFVQNRNIVFYNSTKKITHDGPCPYEIGHILPLSLLNSKANDILNKSIRELVKLLDVENGIIHAEWMVNNNNQPYLIEAAGRAPGGFITDLISNAYNINFFKVLIEVLTNQKIDSFSKIPIKINSMRWLNPKNGKVVKVSNLQENFLNIPELKLLSGEITTKVGDAVTLENNQTRVDYFLCESQPSDKIEEQLDVLSNSLLITEDSKR